MQPAASPAASDTPSTRTRSRRSTARAVLEVDPHAETFIPLPDFELGVGAQGIEDGSYLLGAGSVVPGLYPPPPGSGPSTTAAPAPPASQQRLTRATGRTITPAVLMTLTEDADPVNLAEAPGFADWGRTLGSDGQLPSELGADAWLASVLPASALSPPHWRPLQVSAALVVEQTRFEPRTANLPVVNSGEESADDTSTDDTATAVTSVAVRDARARQELAQGELQVAVLANAEVLSGSRALAVDEKRLLQMRLIGVRNLFARGLVSMPRTYITRIVFDVHHKTLSLWRGMEVRGTEKSGERCGDLLRF